MTTKFVIKDAFYLSNIISQIYNIEQFINIDEIGLDNDVKEFTRELLNCKETFKWSHKETERDEAFQTALFIIGGEKGD